MFKKNLICHIQCSYWQTRFLIAFGVHTAEVWYFLTHAHTFALEHLLMRDDTVKLDFKKRQDKNQPGFKN